MTRARYAPRVPVHPDRYGPLKTRGPNRLAVLHTSESPEGLAAASALAQYQTRPGDRPDGEGGVYGSSYAQVFDRDLLCRPCVPYEVVSFSASGANHDGVHGVFPGVARQSREQWLDEISLDYIATAAAWLVDVRDQLGIPLTRVNREQVRAGRWGVCDHYTITLAYEQTNHTDVGLMFPWDVLYDHINDLIVTRKDEGMYTIDYEPNTAKWARVSLAGGRLTWVRGTASGVVDDFNLPKQQVSRTELLDLITSFGTSGPSPWDQDKPGHAPADQQLHDWWVGNARN